LFSPVIFHRLLFSPQKNPFFINLKNATGDRFGNAINCHCFAITKNGE
jgi:hypothetical protein